MKFTFTPVTTSKIRGQVNNAVAGYSRFVEVEDLEFFGALAAAPPQTSTGW